MGLRHLSGSAAAEQDALQWDVFSSRWIVFFRAAKSHIWREIRTIILSHVSGVVAQRWIVVRVRVGYTGLYTCYCVYRNQRSVLVNYYHYFQI